MKAWQFDVLFWTGVAGIIIMLFAPWIGLELSPISVSGFGALWTYLFTQRGNIVKNKDEDDDGKHRRSRSSKEGSDVDDRA